MIKENNIDIFFNIIYGKSRTCRIFRQSLNNLNASYLEPALADQFEYSSFWILETLKGKEEFLAYFAGKMDLIKAKGGDLKAELIIWNKYDGEQHKSLNPNIFLFQKVVDKPGYKTTMVQLVDADGNINDYMLVSVLLKYADGKIISAYIFPVEMLGPYQRTGIFPV